MKTKVKLKTYTILERAVEEGIAYGYNRAFKHDSKPLPESIQELVLQGVMNELCEVIDFEK